jgi:hypothetical protein
LWTEKQHRRQHKVERQNNNNNSFSFCLFFGLFELKTWVANLTIIRYYHEPLFKRKCLQKREQKSVFIFLSFSESFFEWRQHIFIAHLSSAASRKTLSHLSCSDDLKTENFNADLFRSQISDPQNRLMPVTPIQGPIFIKNNSVPVVPLYSYPTVQNGTFMQIPVST